MLPFHGNIKTIQSTQTFGKLLVNDDMLYLFLYSNRYTQSKDNQTVYASLLVWPNSTSEITLGATVTSGSTTVNLLGFSGSPLKWRSGGASGIVIDVSSVTLNSIASDWAWVFKLQNVSPKPKGNIMRKY